MMLKPGDNDYSVLTGFPRESPAFSECPMHLAAYAAECAEPDCCGLRLCSFLEWLLYCDTIAHETSCSDADGVAQNGNASESSHRNTFGVEAVHHFKVLMA
eukprot:1814502-Amphidinium_carterae.2